MLYDITRPIFTGMPVYPGDPATTLTQIADDRPSGGASVSLLSMCVHAGTHVDAPSHFLPGGAGAEALNLEILNGRVKIVEFETFLREKPYYKRILVKNHQPLVRWPAGVTMPRLIGVDAMSVGKEEVHRALLTHATIILEGLDLAAVPPGEYRLCCLPMLIPGADGAPARATLWEEEE